MKNFNRQYGADMSTLGKNKCDVMLEKALLINPEIRATTFREGISRDNISAFLEGVAIFMSMALTYLKLM